MSNTPFLFIRISFIVSIMISLENILYMLCAAPPMFLLGELPAAAPNFCFSTLR